MRTIKSGAKSNWNTFLFFLLFPLLFCSCVSIKPTTVELSAQVGQRISEMQNIHQLALQRYFDMEKQKVEDFLTNTWEPLFLKNFLGTSNILALLQNVSRMDEQTKNILKEAMTPYLMDKTKAEKLTTDLVGKISVIRKGEDEIVRTTLTGAVAPERLDAAVIHISSLLGTDEPARIIFDFAEAAHQEMQAQRKELLAPIEEAKAQAAAALSEAYSELIRGQSTITGRLEAAAKISKQQDELLGKLGISRISKEATDRLTSISSKVNDALKAVGDAKGGDAGAILKALKEGLNKKTDSPKTN